MKMLPANGAAIPALGMGTWTLSGRKCFDLVIAALEAGYRHIDTAAMYENERQVGEAIRASGVARGEIFLTTKVWHTDLAENDFRRAVEASLNRLGLDYVDLVLIHWPSKTVPLAETIGALNAVAEFGLARHIGVSNFPTGLLAEAISLSDRPLACNQVEYHPFLNQDRVLAACRQAGMALISYCPLGRGLSVMAEPAIARAAQAHGRSPAQIVLRWHVQQDGVGAIPRTSRPERLKENLSVFDFELSSGEMEEISALTGANQRICNFGFSPQWDPV